MIAWQTVTWRAAVIGRWMAIFIGSFLALFFLAFFFGEGPPRFFSELTAPERVQFVAMFALYIGLAIADKWEGLGGLLALAGFASLVAVDPSHLKLWISDAAATIAVVHIVCGWRLRTGPPAGLIPWHVPRDIVWALLAILVAFVLLSANEIFGQPPLMTPKLYPSPDLVGAWTQTASVDVALTIHNDTSVTGTIGGTEITAAHVTYGRSWFGKLLNWNADYVIRGHIQNRDFAVPLMASTTGLSGSLFREGRPARLDLTKR